MQSGLSGKGGVRQMIRLTIDNKTLQSAPGTTVLQAARSAGIYIPALCFKEGFKPATSCMVCVVRVEGVRSLVPACGLRVSEGMRVITDSDEIRKARTAAIELLLSDHSGDCVAPCEIGCPANMDIPQMLRQIAAGDLAGAIATIKKDIPLPATLGRICPAPCEKVCRRAAADGAVSIRLLKRFAADADLSSDTPFKPSNAAPIGKKVAIIGAGPAGLSAAYYLRQGGVQCDLYDRHPHPGGGLRSEQIDRSLLPESVIDREIDILLSQGIQFYGNTRLGTEIEFGALTNTYNAVLLAVGTEVLELAKWSIPIQDNKIQANRGSYRVLNWENLFAAGTCIGSRNLCVRAVADGKEAAKEILNHLTGLDCEPLRPYNHRLGKLNPDRLKAVLAGASAASRLEPEELGDREAANQARRCLKCDCGKKNNCGLRELATEFKAVQKAWSGELSAQAGDRSSQGLIQFDAGKCIKCGLCVQEAIRNGEKPGPAFEGRGFAMRVAVPLGGFLNEAERLTAQKYAAVCPTGAMCLADER
ncbi:MAG: 2Fe-2S iron-sulfur cluster-binding protein [Planctomycetaceae bacterium]|nr:2Fe-2S iron-sulfur cluster-binding protein [Planctomycetaceae bacterium]